MYNLHGYFAIPWFRRGSVKRKRRSPIPLLKRWWLHPSGFVKSTERRLPVSFILGHEKSPNKQVEQWPMLGGMGYHHLLSKTKIGRTFETCKRKWKFLHFYCRVLMKKDGAPRGGPSPKIQNVKYHFAGWAAVLFWLYYIYSQSPWYKLIQL